MFGADQSLQLPYIPDPGRPEDEFTSNVKLDFDVRLGASLARDMRVHPVNRSLGLTHQGRQSTTNLYATNQSTSDVKTNGESLTRVKKESIKNSKPTFTPDSKAEISSESAREKLQRVMRTVFVILRVCIALKRYVQTAQTKTWSFMEMYLHMKEDINQVVAFNPQSFARADLECDTLKQVLSLRPEDRTQQDVKTILALMRGNTSFQDYPTNVQMELAVCMEYQSYEARRIILQQGHRAEAFYILLSGYVMANVEEKDVKSGKTFIKTVKEMGPGNTFGEIALIEGGRRTATIVCKTNVQLLVIMKEDFDTIIRKQLLKQINEQALFCSSIPLLKDFPCQLLAENPSHFFFQYFKKGDIVVKDSSESKYIIVVKAGKCIVVSSHRNDPMEVKETLPAHVRKDLEEAFPFYKDMEKMRNLRQRGKTEADKRKEAVCLGLLTGKVDRTRLADHGPDGHRPKSTVTSERLGLSKMKPFYRQKSNSFTGYYTQVSKDRKDKIETDEDLYSDLQDDFWSRRLKSAGRSKTATGIRRNKSAAVRPLSGTSSARQRTRPAAQRTSTIAQLAELNTGTLFGLESLVQKPPVTVSLVSDGAECIFISKRFFLGNANIKCLRTVTDTVQTYPSRDIIETDLRSYRKWNSYKAKLIKDIVNRVYLM